MLTIIAAARGWFASSWGIKLMAGIKYSSLPGTNQIRVDARSLVFTIGLAVLVALALAILPLLVHSKLAVQVPVLSWRKR